ncbi:hypothetical protein F6X40_36310 [Paraburkholderia sp. UCT31]|uniref:hypothetical protein n=1 Tax=Paraburkholderia sp. UCT31 TaxID=2615209 RepID=UPI001656024A|nr:hypothetical protein [Paraburkholderia sp. UCT31]MBC8742005.1 hypothetical protein [Paraburkholderia sp. UCT31]
MSVVTEQISFVLANRDDGDALIARNFSIYLDALHDPDHFAYSREMRPRFVDAMLDYAAYLGAERTNELLKKRFAAPEGVVTIETLRTHPSDLEKKDEEDASIGGYILKLPLKQAPSAAARTAIDALLKKLALV